MTEDAATDAEKNKKKTRRPKGDGGLYYDEKRDLWFGIVWVLDDDGRRKQKRAASKSKAIAQQKLNALRTDKHEGRVTIAQAKISTVGEWLDYWITSVRSSHIAPTTHRDYAMTIRLYIKPQIGHIKLDKLTPNQIRRMTEKLTAGTDKTKPSTRNAQKAHRVLKAAYKQAVLDRVVRINPCLAVENPKHKKKRRGAFADDLTQHILLVAAKQDDKSTGKAKLATRWAAAFMTGARKSELLGLEWSRVNLKAGVMDISWQLQRHQMIHGCGPRNPDGKYPCKRERVGYCPNAKWNLPAFYDHRLCYRSLLWTRPKSDAGDRKVPIAPMLLAALKVHQKMDTGKNPHGLVWHHPDGRPISPEDDSEAWNALMAAAGIDKRPYESVLHEARNTAATMMLESGVDVKIIQDIMGHASILQTRDYQRVSLALAGSAVKGAFSGLELSGPSPDQSSKQDEEPAYV